METSAPGSDHNSRAKGDVVAAPPFELASTGSPLMRKILDTHGKEILESASEQFLTLALEKRLETLPPGDLLKLLTNRIGCQKSDGMDDEFGAPAVLRGNANARSKLNEPKTSKPLGAITKEFCPTESLLSEPSSAKTHLPATNGAGFLKESPKKHRNVSKKRPAQDASPGSQSPRVGKKKRRSGRKLSLLISAQTPQPIVISDSESEGEDINIL